MSSAILILSGPSGAGKTTIINAASKHIGDYYFSISSTSRLPRDGETDGKEYLFVSKDEFQKGIDDDEFLEYAVVHGNYYGTSLKPVREALKQGKLVIFDIDVQGFHLAMDKMGDLITSAFILPPSLSELEKRLTNRVTDSPQVIAQRVENAKVEIRELDVYDFVIVNDDIEKAAQEFASVANAARLKMGDERSRVFMYEWLAT